MSQSVDNSNESVNYDSLVLGSLKVSQIRALFDFEDLLMSIMSANTELKQVDDEYVLFIEAFFEIVWSRSLLTKTTGQSSSTKMERNVSNNPSDMDTVDSTNVSYDRQVPYTELRERKASRDWNSELQRQSSESSMSHMETRTHPGTIMLELETPSGGLRCSKNMGNESLSMITVMEVFGRSLSPWLADADAYVKESGSPSPYTGTKSIGVALHRIMFLC